MYKRSIASHIDHRIAGRHRSFSRLTAHFCRQISLLLGRHYSSLLPFLV